MGKAGAAQDNRIKITNEVKKSLNFDQCTKENQQFLIRGFLAL